MYIWFFVSALCMFTAIYVHLKSVEHIELQKKYGHEKGVKIGKTYGTASGTMEFVSLIGLWVSPQPRFAIPIFPHLRVSIAYFSMPILHLTVSLPLIVLGAWIAIRGVKTTGLETSETHRAPEKLETTGPYSIVRHPQYLGWILTHIGGSILLSGLYSTFFTPVLVLLIYLISRKEEEELILEFGEEYEAYQRRVPMLIPRF